MEASGHLFKVHFPRQLTQFFLVPAESSHWVLYFGHRGSHDARPLPPLCPLTALHPASGSAVTYDPMCQLRGQEGTHGVAQPQPCFLPEHLFCLHCCAQPCWAAWGSHQAPASP